MKSLMTLGGRLTKIRTFRKMTQAALGVACGFNPTNASIRISQYEMNKKVPKDEVIDKLAEVLEISKYHLTDSDIEGVGFIIHLFWMEESDFSPFHIFPLPSAKTHPDDDSVFSIKESYGDAYKHKRKDIAIAIENPGFDEFTKRWMEMKRKLIAKEITHDEYFDWKLKWPDNADYPLPDYDAIEEFYEKNPDGVKPM